LAHTAADHLATASEYAGKAAEHRKEVDTHRRMFAAYERLVADLATQPAPRAKRGKTFPSPKRGKATKDQLAEYRAHCEAYIRGAEALAEEADRLAELHRARARELSERSAFLLGDAAFPVASVLSARGRAAARERGDQGRDEYEPPAA
jgi:hypothetical protein